MRTRHKFFEVILLIFAMGNANALTVFDDDFSSSAIDSNWSSSTSLGIDTTPSGERFLGRLDGSNYGLSNDLVQLDLRGLPYSGVATVLFDLYIIRSIDGVEPFRFFTGPDLSFVFVSTFSNLIGPPFRPIATQSYPYPGAPSTTGSLSVGNLKYGLINPSHYSDSTYRLEFSFPYTGNALTLNWSMLDLQSLSDESWGIDNVRVSVVPEPSVFVMMLAGAIFLYVRRRRVNAPNIKPESVTSADLISPQTKILIL